MTSGHVEFRTVIVVAVVWKITVVHNCGVVMHLCDSQIHTYTLSHAQKQALLSLPTVISRRVKAILICKGFWVTRA